MFQKHASYLLQEDEDLDEFSIWKIVSNYQYEVFILESWTKTKARSDLIGSVRRWCLRPKMIILQGDNHSKNDKFEEFAIQIQVK